MGIHHPFYHIQPQILSHMSHITQTAPIFLWDIFRHFALSKYTQILIHQLGISRRCGRYLSLDASSNPSKETTGQFEISIYSLDMEKIAKKYSNFSKILQFPKRQNTPRKSHRPSVSFTFCGTQHLSDPIRGGSSNWVGYVHK